MKRRVIALLIVLALLLTGCGGSNESGVAGKIKSGQQNVEETTASTTAPPEHETGELLYGTIEGNSYIDKHAGFGCDFDENWDLSLEERGSELPDSSVCFANFQATNEDGYSFIDIQYIDMSEEDLAQGRALSDDEVVDLILESDEIIKDILEGSDYAISTSEKVSVTFLGEETVAALSTCSSTEIPVYFLQYSNYAMGNYNLVITIMTIFENTTTELFAKFYSTAEQGSQIAEGEKKLSHGLLEGTTYIDEQSGFAFDFDNDWQLEGDYYADEDMSEVEEGSGYFRFNADLVDGPFSINMNYVCVSEVELNNSRNSSRSDIADGLMHFKDAWKKIYESVGWKVESIKKVKTEFLGKETYGMLITCTANDQYMYALKIKEYFAGGYYAEITVTSHLENYTDELLAMFYKV